MEALRQSMERLPFFDVSTYIQSGNIVLSSRIDDNAEIQQMISKTIKSDFGFDVSVIVVTPEILEQVIENNPFVDRQIPDPAQPYVAFLSNIPDQTALDSLSAMEFGIDEWAFSNHWLYLLYESAGRTKLTNAVIERRLGVTSTARNWKTVHKLLELSRV